MRFGTISNNNGQAVITPRKKTYDAACFGLAERFLMDGPQLHNHVKRCESLAIAIQETIEEWTEANPVENED